MNKQRVLFTALLSVLLLFLSVSCETVREVFTTVPNMRTEAALAERQEKSNKTETDNKKETQEEPLQIQMFKLRKNSIDFSIANNNVNAVHDGARSIVIKYPPNGDIVAKATWDALKEEENEIISGADATFEPGKAIVIFAKEITKEQFETFIANASEVAVKCFEVLNPPVIISEKDTDKEQIQKTVQPEPDSTAQPEVQETVTETNIPSEIQIAVNEQKNPESVAETEMTAEPQKTEDTEAKEARITKAPVPVDEEKSEVKKTKPPMMDKAGIGIIIITIAIAIAASMVVYFAVIRRRKY